MSDKDITQMIRKDITERLRDRDNHDSLEAADEIERLREERETYFKACDELLAQTIELRSERDEARREVCDLKTFNYDNTITSYHYADLRKWDCFKSVTKSYQNDS